MTATKKPARQALTPGTIAHAVTQGRAAVEKFVQTLAPEDVLPFLAQAAPVSKAFSKGVELAESRVKLEGLIEMREWKDDDGAEHTVGDWLNTATGEQYVWKGSIGDPECGDPAGFRSALEMEDVEKAVLDNTFTKVWKIDFSNVKRIRSEGARLAKSGDPATKARGERIVSICKDFIGRKHDGPPHLSEKE